MILPVLVEKQITQYINLDKEFYLWNIEQLYQSLSNFEDIGI